MQFRSNIHELFRQYALINMEKKNIFYPEHQGVPGVYFLKKGIVRVYKKNKEGGFMSWLGFAGDFMGLDTAFTQDIRSHWYITADRCELHFIPTQDFLALVASDQLLLSDILHFLSEKSDKIESRITDINIKHVDQKFLRLLYGFSERNIYKIIPDILSTTDVANLIGTTKNYVYKMIQRLEDDLIISFKGRHLIIVNKTLLHKSVQPEKKDSQHS